MSNKIDTLISDAIDDTSKLLNLLNYYEKKYGTEKLREILSEHKYIEKNISTVKRENPLYGAAVESSPETVDPTEFVKLVQEAKEISEQRPENNDFIEKPKPGPNESDSLESFGLYRKLMEMKEQNPQAASIYSQDPNTLAKIEEDRINHPVEEKSSIVEEKPNFEQDKSLTKVLEMNNPWSDAGAPVAPGQIKL